MSDAATKLKIIDWVRQQTRDDPVSLALKMPWIAARAEAWEEAKQSGDADAMTKAYAELLRGIEAEQNRRLIPKPEQRVLSKTMAEQEARVILLQTPPEKMLEALRDMQTRHGEYGEAAASEIEAFLPQPLRAAFRHPSALVGELMWKRTLAKADPNDLLPDLSELGAKASGRVETATTGTDQC